MFKYIPVFLLYNTIQAALWQTGAVISINHCYNQLQQKKIGIPKHDMRIGKQNEKWSN